MLAIFPEKRYASPLKTVLHVALLNAGIGVLMLAGWLALRPRGQISVVTDIAFPLAIGLITYFGGRLNGAIWLIVPLTRLLMRPVDADSVVSGIECVLIYAFTSGLITRGRRLADAQNQLAALLASMEDVVLVLDSGGRYLVVVQSPGLVRPVDELVGRNLTDIFDRAEAALFLEKIRQALGTRQTVTVDYTILVNGEERWFSAAVSPMSGETVVWVARDVTQTKKTEAALQRLNDELEQRIAERTRELADTVDVLHREEAARVKAIEAFMESQKRFELVSRATDDVIWDWDVTTNTLWMSEAYATRFGGEPHPDIEQFFERIHDDDRERVHRKLEESLESDDVKFSSEYRFRREDGSYAMILDRGHVARDESGSAKRMVGAMIDLSEHYRLLERLEQEKRVSGLGRIAASIAHEINNLTMAIQSNLEAVRHLAIPQMHTSLDHVFTAINRSKRITDQILRYTRPMPPETRPVSVKRLMEAWKEEIAAVLPPSIEFSATVSDPRLFVDADPLQIAQVLTNLALNAKDAMLPQGGLLSVEAFADSDSQLTGDKRDVIHFRVADTGCGMTSDQLTSAFEPLFTTKRQGTGLGLTVSQQIATQHGGYLFAESTHGRGAMFHLLLPASRGVEPEVSTADAATSFGRRILLVEDDPSVAAGLTTLLETAGVEVSVCHEGAGALAAVTASRPDYVILDVGLPDLDGTEVFERIRATFPTLPVVFSSGHADASKLQRYLEMEHVVLLVKPYSFADLTATLSALPPGCLDRD